MSPGWVEWLPGEVPHRLAASRGRTLLMFGSDGCGTCRAARTRVPALATGRIDTLVYLDAERAAGLVREFEVFHLPALLLFLEGAFHGALEAPLSAPAFAAALEAVYAAPAAEAP